MGSVTRAVDGRHARVVHAAVVLVFGLPGKRRVAVDHPGRRRGGKRPLVENEVPEAVRVLVRPVEAIQKRAVLVHGTRAIDRVPLEPEAPELHRRAPASARPADLGNHVDRAGGLTRSVEHRDGPCKISTALHVGKVAWGVARIEEAVLPIVAEVTRNPRRKKASGRSVSVTFTLPAHVAQQVVDADHLLVGDHCLRDNADRGRDIDLQHVDQRAGGG